MVRHRSHTLFLSERLYDSDCTLLRRKRQRLDIPHSSISVRAESRIVSRSGHKIDFRALPHALLNDELAFHAMFRSLSCTLDMNVCLPWSIAGRCVRPHSLRAHQNIRADEGTIVYSESAIGVVLTSYG